MYRLKWFIVATLLVTVTFGLAGCGSGPGALVWGTITDGGEVLTYQVSDIPSTVLRQPQVLASGDVDDPALLAAVRQVTGRTQAQVVELLTSFDSSGPDVVEVLVLRYDAHVARYWSDPNAKLGRWYAPIVRGQLSLPAEARQFLALPLANTGRYVTLYRFKPGLTLLRGACADMAGNPDAFGPYATGGGEQYYAPDATLWVVDHVELNPAAIELVSELRFPQGVQ